MFSNNLREMLKKSFPFSYKKRLGKSPHTSRIGGHFMEQLISDISFVVAGWILLALSRGRTWTQMSVLIGMDWQVTVASVSQASLWKCAPSLGFTAWWEVSGSRGGKKGSQWNTSQETANSGMETFSCTTSDCCTLLLYIFLGFCPACFVFYCFQWNRFGCFPWETITKQPHSTCCQVFFFFYFPLISSLLFMQCFVFLCVSVQSISHMNTSLKYLLAAFSASCFKLSCI